MLRACDICQKEFQKLGVHKANAHTDLALECSICGKRGFKNTKGLGAHKAAMHNGQTRARMLSGFEKGHKLIECSLCGKIIANYGVLGRHNILEHGTEEERNNYLQMLRDQQVEKMKDPELKAKMMKGLLIEDRSAFYSEERKFKQAERFRKLRNEHPEWDRLGAEAYAKKMHELFPRNETDYPYEWGTELKKVVKNRDNWKCCDCGVGQNELKQEHRRLAVHHLDLNKANLDLENLITVCFSCHMKRHHVIRQEIYAW